MKTKQIYLIAITFLLLFNISCKKDVEDTPQALNEFTVQGADYLTPNAYLILDDGPSVYTNGFMLAFLEGTMREDSTNGSSISTDTNHGIALVVMHGGTVNSEQAVVINNTTYALDDETSTLTNITNYTNTYTHNGIQYGDPDDTGANEYIINNGTGGSVIINSINIDYVARNGTIDCSYDFLDENNVRVIGQFLGSFEIINEF
ncbi:MAG TPA: hypothetical protein EYG92_11625 [Lutibacter sp.]|nr:hypothetical protein [Lutibacter sp.]